MGVPVFDDLTEGDWYSSRTEPVPPPPPFEETPERPLFAPDPPEGRAARVPRTPRADTGTGAAPGARPAPASGPGRTTHRPRPRPPTRTSDDDGRRVPGRNWLRIAMLIALGLVILLASLFAFNRGRDQGSSGDDGGRASPSPSASSTAPAEPIAIASVADFDPFGDPQEENADQAPLAIDGEPGTAWTTSTYEQNFGPSGLKDGVGLLLDLGKAQDVGSVDVTLVGSPTSVQLLTATGPQAPTAVDGFDVAAEGDAGEDEGHAHPGPAGPGPLARDLADVGARRGRLPGWHRGGRGPAVTHGATPVTDPGPGRPARTRTCSPPTWPATRRPSAPSSPGTGTGSGRSRCAPWATPRTPRTRSRTG